jgi:hypothetical protein
MFGRSALVDVRPLSEVACGHDDDRAFEPAVIADYDTRTALLPQHEEVLVTSPGPLAVIPLRSRRCLKWVRSRLPGKPRTPKTERCARMA